MDTVEIEPTKHSYEIIKKVKTREIKDPKQFKIFLKNVEKLKRTNEKIQKHYKQFEELMETKYKTTAILEHIMTEE